MDNRDETTEKNFPFLKKERDFLWCDAPEQVLHKYPNKYRTSTGQVHDMLHTDNYNIICLIKVIGLNQLSTKDLMSGLNLKGRDNFLNLYLLPSIADGYVRPLYPDKPHHPRQKYLLTVKGLALYQELTKGE